MDEAVRAWSSPTSSRTGGFPAHAAPCKITLNPSSFNCCQSRMLISFPEYKGPDPAPKGGQFSFHPVGAGGEIEVLGGCESSVLLWDGLNHILSP